MPGEMPTDCTYQMFCAARETVFAEQDRTITLKLLNQLDVLTDTKTPIVEHWVKTQRKDLIKELET